MSASFKASSRALQSDMSGDPLAWRVESSRLTSDRAARAAPPYPRRFKRDSPYPPLPTSTSLTRLYPLPAANLARSVWFGSFAFPPLGSPRHDLGRAFRVAIDAVLVQLDYLHVRMDSFTQTILGHIVVLYELKTKLKGLSFYFVFLSYLEIDLYFLRLGTATFWHLPQIKKS